VTNSLPCIRAPLGKKVQRLELKVAWASCPCIRQRPAHGLEASLLYTSPTINCVKMEQIQELDLEGAGVMTWKSALNGVLVKPILVMPSWATSGGQKRLVKTANALMDHPGGSLPEKLKDWSSLMGLYRLGAATGG